MPIQHSNLKITALNMEGTDEYALKNLKSIIIYDLKEGRRLRNRRLIIVTCIHKDILNWIVDRSLRFQATKINYT